MTKTAKNNKFYKPNSSKQTTYNKSQTLQNMCTEDYIQSVIRQYLHDSKTSQIRHISSGHN